MKYKIRDIEFDSKSEITNYCRALMIKYKDTDLKDDDLLFILELLSYHKDSNKLKGYSRISVALDKLNKNYCLWVHKIKKDIELKDDISFTKCISNIPVTTDLKIDYIFKFGKYKGVSIYDIDDDNYLKWVLDKFTDLKRGDRILINQYLKYRYIPYNPMFWKHNPKKVNKS